MKRFLSHIVLLILAVGCSKPLIIQIDDLPDNTPGSEPIYITGNFNHWNPGDPTYQISRDSTGGGYIEIPRGIGHLEYKFTRGSWESEELDSCGNTIPNRVISNLQINEVNVEIEQWKDRPERFCDGIVVLIKVPDETPFPNEIYLTGEFNGWQAGGSQYRAEYAGENIYRLELPKSYSGKEFKVTRGTWTTVEVSENGRDIVNRRLTNGRRQRIEVSLWKDFCLQEHPYRYLRITDLPESTPLGSSLHFASNINGWNPSSSEYKFEKMADGDYIIRIPNSPDPIEFKITRGGNWHTVETGKNGYEISNRKLSFGIQDTIDLVVHNWKDQPVQGPNESEEDY